MRRSTHVRAAPSAQQRPHAHGRHGGAHEPRIASGSAATRRTSHMRTTTRVHGQRGLHGDTRGHTDGGKVAEHRRRAHARNAPAAKPASRAPRLDAAAYSHPNLFPPVPVFDGVDVDEYHESMVEYNDVIRDKRRARQTKDVGVWEKHMKLYAHALHDYNATMEARNRSVLARLGGWRLPRTLGGTFTRRDLPGMGSQTAFVLSPLVAAAVAQQLPQVSERIGYRELVIRLAKSERSNTRCIVTDEGLASMLWDRVRAEIPKQLQSAEGPMEPYCVSPRFRFCRYEAGQLFAAHKDDRYRNSSSSLASLLTLVVYLNEDFTGGKLNFLRRPWPQGTTADDRDRDVRGSAASRNIMAQVTPTTGLAAVFSQSLLHEGSPLTSGVKYLVRTDIVYKVRGRHVPRVHMDRQLPFDSVA